MYKLMFVALTTLGLLAAVGQLAAQDPTKPEPTKADAKKTEDEGGVYARQLSWKERVESGGAVALGLGPIVLQVFIVILLMGIRSDMNEAVQKLKGGGS